MGSESGPLRLEMQRPELFLHVGKDLHGSRDPGAFAFPSWPSGQSYGKIS